MSLKSREVRSNKDGSRTEKVRYSDGSGHDKTTKGGGFFPKHISTKTYPAKKR